MRRRNSQAQAKNEAPAVPAEAQPKTQLGQAEGDLVRSLNGLMLNSSTYTVEVDGEAKSITPTEFTLLDVLLGSNGHIRTKTELVRRLRDEESDSGTYVSSADERSVEVHMGNLRRKLGDSTRDPRWIETVRGVGYRSAAKR